MVKLIAVLKGSVRHKSQEHPKRGMSHGKVTNRHRQVNIVLSPDKKHELPILGDEKSGN